MRITRWMGGVLVAATLWSLAGRATNLAGGDGQSAGSKIDACAMLSAEDAQKIMGVPMQPKKVSNPSVCMYQEAVERPKDNASSGFVSTNPEPRGEGSVSLAMNKRSSKAAEDAGWGLF